MKLALRMILAVIGLQAMAVTVHSAEPVCKAGVAVKIITPDQLMWMAGYSARTHPASALR